MTKPLTIDKASLRGWPRVPTANLSDLGLTDPPSTLEVTDGPLTHRYRLTVPIQAHGGFPRMWDYHCCDWCGTLRLVDV